ncbi:MAG TPA: DHA2 family efflux MFS transporter permease subunit [Terriglobales bacterium]|nr:DHA2 family efflux MFS transporter permease subunit [Terriglobales bacterium]
MATASQTFNGSASRAWNEVNPWLVAIAVMCSTFMEVLDTTVVNVSLPHIAGSLSATTDEATWALTSYLVANAIILPMTGWLANFFGRKRLLLVSVIGFTAASFLCGLAPTLPLLIVFRCIQGACGGGLQPLSQAILMEVFPPQDRGKAMGFWGLGIVVAPMLGPVLGGWLTDSYSWRWVFYINVPIGILAVFLTSVFVFDPSYIKRSTTKIDFWGMGYLALGISCLQIMLDKGQELDWFGSNFIRVLCIFAVGGLAAFVIRELTTEHPIVDLSVFKIRTYATGVFLMTVLGFVLYGSTVLVPLLLQTVLGYPALNAGVAMLPRGLGSFIAMPVVGAMMSRVKPRYMLVGGTLLGSFAMFRLAHLNLDVGYWNFFWALIWQGVGMGLMFIPLTTITNDPIPVERMGNATSIFNLMRNIGASIGISLVLAIQTRHAQMHVNSLTANVTPSNLQAQGMVNGMKSMMMAQGGADPATAQHMANGMIENLIRQQAAIMSFNDIFWLLAVIFLCMLPLIFLMSPPKKKAGVVIAH